MLHFWPNNQNNWTGWLPGLFTMYCLEKITLKTSIQRPKKLWILYIGVSPPMMNACSNQYCLKSLGVEDEKSC